jgi:hypothetical protein
VKTNLSVGFADRKTSYLAEQIIHPDSITKRYNSSPVEGYIIEQFPGTWESFLASLREKDAEIAQIFGKILSKAQSETKPKPKKSLLRKGLEGIFG